MKQNQLGFTLVELIVVMAVFIIVIIISADAFNTVISQSIKIFRSEESNIEGVVGLEMMRHDLQQGGFGLFTEPSPLAYSEASSAPANGFNETVSNNPPRAFVASNNLTAVNENSSGSVYGILANTDYISIKGTTVARSSASQKWTYLQYITGTGVIPYSWPSATENFGANERVVLMHRQVSAADNTLTLIPNGTSHNFAYSQTGFATYSTNTSSYIMYGLDTSGAPRMPFNRTDYFIARPANATQIPQMCAPNSVGTLYKTTVNQSDGNLTYFPILDCVADMQIIFGWDLMNGSAPGQDGLVDTWTTPPGTSFSCSGPACSPSDPNYAGNAFNDPATIRNALKMIKVYILAQNGRRDPKYISPSPIIVGGAAEASLTKTYDINAAGLQNYRWKLYQIVVRPKNLTSNQ